jgi:hypothetical protein
MTTTKTSSLAARVNVYTFAALGDAPAPSIGIPGRTIAQVGLERLDDDAAELTLRALRLAEVEL